MGERLREPRIDPYLIYLLVMNLVTLSLFIYDKHRAEQGWIDKRIPEIAPFGFSLVGGAVGASRGCVS